MRVTAVIRKGDNMKIRIDHDGVTKHVELEEE
ncbi:unnamed protein product, partial [marine sediment metagenome]